MPPPKERRIAVLGYRSVGKSSLTIQFVENQFVDSYDPTIENTFHKEMKIGRQDYKLQLVDTAGQDEYSIFPTNYFVNIDGYVLVYSTNSVKSFEVVKFVYERILDMKGKVRVPVVLVGNKSDLRMERWPVAVVLTPAINFLVTSVSCVFSREVSFEEGKRVADSWKAPFLEASAKENQCVLEIFNCIVATIEKSENVNIKMNTQEKSGCILS